VSHSAPTDEGGTQVRLGGSIGGSPELCCRALWGTVMLGFRGKTMWGSTRFLHREKHSRGWLQDGSRWQLPSSKHGRALMVALALFRLQEVVQRLFSWPSLASRLVQWLQLATNSSNLVAARVWQVSSFAGQNLSYGVRYL
jgi:hypothetical protein